ncbi:hypothetical protein [Cryptosporangium sp. NPDC051539]|uniref:hypothetical protein n=1 Tax=Cryptosporangium sp. NPDC051539 TaxID=3363962 RepID=UPI00378DC19A
MATPDAVKGLLRTQLHEVERQSTNLGRLKQRIEEAIAQVESAIGGSASRDDQRILGQLQMNLGEIERSLAAMHNAVAEGRRFVGRT